MRILTGLFCALLLWPGLLAGENLLPNGDFSRGLEGWRVFGKPPAPFVIAGGDGGRPCVEVQGSSGIEATVGALPARVIRVSGRVKWAGVVRGEKAWHRGVVLLEMLDAAGRATGHREIFTAEGSGDWRRFDAQVVLPEAVASVKLQLKGWFVEAGTLWFSDVAIAPAGSGPPAEAGENLVVNGDFALEAGGQSLHWTFPSGEDWDGFALNPAGDRPASWTAAGRAGGGRALRLDAPATAVSEEIAVARGVYRAGGWMKTAGVRAGRSAWCDARIQVVFFDREGKKLAHVDLADASGDTPWTGYAREIVAPTGAARARFYLRLFDTAAGRVWFDDLALTNLRRVPGEPVVRDEAALRVDFSKREGVFPYHLDGVASHYLGEFQAIPWKRTMAEFATRRLGVRSIRFQEAGGDQVGVRRLPSGGLAYDFSRVERTLRTVVNLGLTPMLVLESTPEALASHPRTQWANRFPPRDYAEWEDYIFAYVSWLRDTFGAEEVLRWDFETWNEPEAARYFQGTPEDLMQIHRHTAAAARRALPGIRIGTPGFASSSGGMRAFLNGLDGGEDRPAFVSWHLYSTGTGIPSLLATRLNLERGAQIAGAFPWAKRLPRYLTEWNSGSGSGNAYLGKPYNAAYALTALRMIRDGGVDRAYVFQDCENPGRSPVTEAGYYRGLGLISPQGLIRPFTRAFELLHRMRGGRVDAASAHRPVEVLASVNGDGGWITFWSYVEDPREEFVTRVSLEIAGLPPSAAVPVTLRTIDGRNDPWPRWAAWGKPDLAKDAALWRKLDEATGLEAGRRELVLKSDARGVAHFEWSLPVSGIVSLQVPGAGGTAPEED